MKEFRPYPFAGRQHPARLPALREGREARRHAVAIVGGGPVGLVTALALARQGVASVLLEADDAVCQGSRAICISRRSLEILDRLGAAQPFLDTGLAWSGGRSFYRDTEVLHFTMPHDARQKLPPMINLAQYHIEQFLLDAARRHADLIDIRWQTRVTGLARHAGGVTLDLSTPEGGYALEADWLVACDGGRSTIREAMGLHLQGTSYEGRYIIVDILLDSSRPAERLAYFDPPCNPGSTVLVHKQPDNVWRIDYQVADGEDLERALRPEQVLPRVQSLLEMMGEKGPWAPIWISAYKANALSLERYRHGRVLFAGDAAHLLPIFGVRGANSGIDDADNLGWKLAWVVKGLAHGALLDSYSSERVAAAQENLRQARKSTEFMAPPTSAYALMRKAVLGLAARHPGLRPLINPRQTSAISYTDSPLNADAEPDGAWQGGPAPGEVLTDCLLMRTLDGSGGPVYLSDLLGTGFTLLCFEDGAGPSAEVQPGPDGLLAAVHSVTVLRLGRQGLPAGPGLLAWDPDDRLFELYDACPGCIYVLRPDGHVLGRWRRPDATVLAAAIQRALRSPGLPPAEKEAYERS